MSCPASLSLPFYLFLSRSLFLHEHRSFIYRRFLLYVLPAEQSNLRSIKLYDTFAILRRVSFVRLRRVPRTTRENAPVSRRGHPRSSQPVKYRAICTWRRRRRRRMRDRAKSSSLRRRMSSNARSAKSRPSPSYAVSRLHSASFLLNFNPKAHIFSQSHSN